MISILNLKTIDKHGLPNSFLGLANKMEVEKSIGRYIIFWDLLHLKNPDLSFFTNYLRASRTSVSHHIYARIFGRHLSSTVGRL